MTGANLRADGTPHAVYLIQGDDLGLVSQALSSLLEELSTLDEGGAMPVEEYGTASRDEPFPFAAVLDACRTPPFLADRRVVVVRDAPQLDAEQTKELLAYLAAPLETTVLLLTYGGRNAPAAVTKSVRAGGVVLDAVPPGQNRARTAWVGERLHGAGVRLDHEAAALLQGHLGEDLSRLQGILATLEATFGPGAKITPSELGPFLGAEGGVAPWDLTDALASSKEHNTSDAIRALHRLVGGGERHPLQVLATLHRHYGAMLRLDGSDATDDRSAAALTGMSPFPARKALEQTRRLGHRRVARAIELIAEADLDLRGRVAWPPELVLEVLVARLARLTREPATARRG